MQPVRTYVVRIYRRDRRVVAGLVEDVRTGRSTPFRSVVDLIAVLTGRPRPARAADDDSSPPAAPPQDTTP